MRRRRLRSHPRVRAVIDSIQTRLDLVGNIWSPTQRLKVGDVKPASLHCFSHKHNDVHMHAADVIVGKGTGHADPASVIYPQSCFRTPMALHE